MECLELGASDFITKPGGSISTDLTAVSEHLVELLASYGSAYARAHGKQTHDSDYFSHQIKMREAERFVAEKKGIAPAKNPAIAPTLWNQTAEKNKEPAVVVPLREGGRIEVVVIGISTGGPNTLRDAH